MSTPTIPSAVGRAAARQFVRQLSPANLSSVQTSYAAYLDTLQSAPARNAFNAYVLEETPSIARVLRVRTRDLRAAAKDALAQALGPNHQIWGAESEPLGKRGVRFRFRVTLYDTQVRLCRVGESAGPLGNEVNLFLWRVRTQYKNVLSEHVVDTTSGFVTVQPQLTTVKSERLMGSVRFDFYEGDATGPDYTRAVNGLNVRVGI